MTLLLAFTFLATYFVAGAPEAQTTARAELHRRQSQSVDSATIIGYSHMGGFYNPDPNYSPWSLVPCEDQKEYQTSGSYARCGYAQSSFNSQYATACSGDTVLYAGSQTEACNVPSSICDTAYIVPYQDGGESSTMIACWSTTLVFSSVDLVRSTVTAPVTGSASTTGSQTDSSEYTSQPSLTSDPTTKSTGAAALGVTYPNTGFAGLVAGLLALL